MHVQRGVTTGIVAKLREERTRSGLPPFASSLSSKLRPEQASPHLASPLAVYTEGTSRQ